MSEEVRCFSRGTFWFVQLWRDGRWVTVYRTTDAFEAVHTWRRYLVTTGGML